MIRAACARLTCATATAALIPTATAALIPIVIAIAVLILTAVMNGVARTSSRNSRLHLWIGTTQRRMPS